MIREKKDEVVLVFTTLPADEDAMPLATVLVEEGLAACVTVHPEVRSVYRWQNAIESADEQQLVFKTTADRVESLRARLKEVHPYDLPELLVASVEGDAAYLDWVRASTRPTDGGSRGASPKGGTAGG